MDGIPVRSHLLSVPLSQTRIAPSRRLARFVRAIRIVHDPAPGLEYSRLPDGELDLIVRLGAARGLAVGTRTRAIRKKTTDPSSVLMVRFHVAGAYPFFGVPISELTDRVIDLEDLWGREHAQRLADPREGVRAAIAFLEQRLAREDVFDPSSAIAVRRVVRSILAGRELPRVRDIAPAIGMSERQLRRSFGAVVGVGPKHWLRIVRFQRAVRAARRDDRADWSQIAERAGYFDQAHMIAEFREMSGETPAAFVRGVSR